MTLADSLSANVLTFMVFSQSQFLSVLFLFVLW